MTRTHLFVLIGGLGVGLPLAAQSTTSRYIVEFKTAPAVAAAAAGRASLRAGSETLAPQALSPQALAAARAQVASEHSQMEQALRSVGATIYKRFDTAFNGMAVELSPDAVEAVRQLP